MKDKIPNLELAEPVELVAHERIRSLHSLNQTTNDYSGGITEIGSELDLGEYWRSIRKHLWLIAGITLLVTTLAAIYAARKPDIFQAEGRLQVNDNNAGGSPNSKNTTAVGNDENEADPTYFNTQIQILSSPALLRRVVKILDLEHNQSFLASQQSQPLSSWQSLLRILHLNKTDQKPAENPTADVLPLNNSSAPREDLVEATRLAPFVDTIKERLTVERVINNRAQSEAKETRLIDVKFQHTDPLLAAKVVNVVCDTFALTNLERRTVANISTSDFLLKRISQLQAQIRSDEERLINYAKNHQILTLDPSQNTVVDRLAGLNRQLLEAENDRKQAEAAYQSALAPGAANALTSAEVRTAEDKLSELRQQRAQLLVENTEEWPEVKQINQEISELEKQIDTKRRTAVANYLVGLETRYHQAQAREQSLRNAFDQQRKETLTQNEAAINYRIIQQEIETNKSLLDGLLQRSRENDVVLAGTPNNVLVLDYAIVPNRPIGPNRLWTIALTFMIALISATGLALGLEYLDDSIRSTRDVEKQLRLPALAVVPSARLIGKKQFVHRSNALKRLSGANQSELLIDSNRNTALVEIYRHLRTTVLLSTAGQTAKTFLIASSLPVEGKTTTAVNFAFSLAQTGAKVLLVDADLRRPRVHSIFGVANKTGLSSFLTGNASKAEVLSLVVPHEESGLHVLTSGPIPANPTELIGSDQMRQFIQHMETTFTHIIFDSSPIAPCTDSVLLSSMVDGVLLVVHGGKSSHKVVWRSRQILSEAGARIFGVVLNNTNVTSADHYYYSHLYSDYYQAEPDNIGGEAH